jgi:hypothetical protein
MPYPIYQKTYGCQMPNAGPELRPEAGAQRTLEAVSSRPLFGSDGAALRGLQQFLDPCPRQRYGVSCLQVAGDTCRVVLVA